MPRIWNVVRLHLVNRWTQLVLPWVTIGVAFALTIAIWMILRSVGITEIGGASGTIWSVYLSLVLMAAILAVNRNFPFALGFSVTRREFSLGTALAFVLISAGNAVLFTALAALETASGGWGLNGQVFTILAESNGSPIAYWFVFFALQMFCYFLGAAVATIYMRWRMNGMVGFWIALSVVVVGGWALISYTDSWGAIGSWLVASGAVGVAAQSLLLTALAGLTGFAILRRATPKS